MGTTRRIIGQKEGRTALRGPCTGSALKGEISWQDEKEQNGMLAAGEDNEFQGPL